MASGLPSSARTASGSSTASRTRSTGCCTSPATSTGSGPSSSACSATGRCARAWPPPRSRRCAGCTPGRPGPQHRRGLRRAGRDRARPRLVAAGRRRPELPVPRGSAPAVTVLASTGSG
jgi:hypothetical protein